MGVRVLNRRKFHYDDNPIANPSDLRKWMRKLSLEQAAEVSRYADRMFSAMLDEGFDSKRARELSDAAAERKAEQLAKGRQSNSGELGPWEFGDEDIPPRRQYAEEVDELNEQIARTHDLKKIARLLKKRAAVSQAAYEADWGPQHNPGKMPAEMSAAEINRRLDQLDKLDSQVSHEFIEAGRGHERPSEYLKQTDPLSMRARAIWDERQALFIEVELRAGPGMRRLPRGFGPRRY